MPNGVYRQRHLPQVIEGKRIDSDLTKICLENPNYLGLKWHLMVSVTLLSDKSYQMSRVLEWARNSLLLGDGGAIW